jgi:hypothetical protein
VAMLGSAPAPGRHATVQPYREWGPPRSAGPAASG